MGLDAEVALLSCESRTRNDGSRWYMSELIVYAKEFGGIGGFVIALGVLMYNIYSKKRDSDTDQLPIHAEIVKITQQQQGEFLKKHNDQTQAFLETQRQEYKLFNDRQNEWAEKQDKKISEQAEELKLLNREVVELKRKIDGLHAEIVSRDRQLMEQASIIERKNNQIAELNKELINKKVRIRELEGLLDQNK